MNNREIIRKWAQKSNASFWIPPLLMFIMYLLYRNSPKWLVGYLFLMVASLEGVSSYHARCLAKEIVRLEEKIEELERRIP
jgi:hypothetical protein